MREVNPPYWSVAGAAVMSVASACDAVFAGKLASVAASVKV
jgi:hypothetical protein